MVGMCLAAGAHAAGFCGEPHKYQMAGGICSAMRGCVFGYSGTRYQP